MVYGITGWKNGGRQCYTQNLQPGQFRGMGKPHVFTSPTYIQNNYYGNNSHCCFDNYDYGCCNNNGMPSWAGWMMGIGMGLPIIGDIIGMFLPSKAEGQGGAEDPAKQTPKDELAGLKELYPKGTFGKVGNLYFAIVDGVRYEGASPEELLKQIPDGTKPAAGQSAAEEVAEGQPVAENEGQGALGGGHEVGNTPLPKLFQNMTEFSTAEQVLTAFKDATGTDAQSIDDAIASGGITIKDVSDRGNKTTYNINDITLTVDDLAKLKNNETITKGNATIENLDGYIRIQVGPNNQTYILGENGTAYQYAKDQNEGNITGYRNANWRKGANSGGGAAHSPAANSGSRGAQSTQGSAAAGNANGANSNMHLTPTLEPSSTPGFVKCSVTYNGKRYEAEVSGNLNVPLTKSQQDMIKNKLLEQIKKDNMLITKIGINWPAGSVEQTQATPAKQPAPTVNVKPTIQKGTTVVGNMTVWNVTIEYNNRPYSVSIPINNTNANSLTPDDLNFAKEKLAEQIKAPIEFIN